MRWTADTYIQINSYISPHWGLKVPSGVQFSLYVHLSVSLSGRLHRFLVINRVDRNCAQCMRPQATGSHPLSDNIICPSVHMSSCPRSFYDFLFVLISSVGVHHCNIFIPTLGSEGPQWVTFKLICPSVCLSVYPSVKPSIGLSVSLSVCPPICPYVCPLSHAFYFLLFQPSPVVCHFSLA